MPQTLPTLESEVQSLAEAEARAMSSADVALYFSLLSDEAVYLPPNSSAMLANAFIGRDHAPSHHDLASTLGSSEKLWRGIIHTLHSAGITDSKDWRSYSTKAGWALRLKHKDRTIVYLSPAIGSFTASFVLGDKALASLDYTELPASAVKLIKEAKRYPEGTAIRVQVHHQGDIDLVKKLAAAKSKH